MFQKYKKLIYIALAVLIVAGIGAYKIYDWVFEAGVNMPQYELFIPTGSNYATVYKKLTEDKVLTEPKGFDFTAKQMKYPEKVKPGRYILKKGMSNREIVGKLRLGDQDPIKFTFTKFRLKKDIIKAISGDFEFKAEELQKLMDDDDFLKDYGLTSNTAIAFFIPNSYNIKWNTTAKEFFERMKFEYNQFWNESREGKRKKLNLSRLDVMTVASIVEEETNQNDEKARVAGVYLNRLRQNWNLGADPTVKYAVGDFTLKRILNVHTAVKSPYNTYQVIGLPPGPICTPSIPSIDGVLDAEEHEYMFFCAQPGLTGHHNFAKDAAGHQKNADEYHKWLNEYQKAKKVADEAAKEDKKG